MGKGWEPNDTKTVFDVNKLGGERIVREREKENGKTETGIYFYNLIWKPITQYPLTLVDYQYRVVRRF